MGEILAVRGASTSSKHLLHDAKDTYDQVLAMEALPDLLHAHKMWQAAPNSTH